MGITPADCPSAGRFVGARKTSHFPHSATGGKNQRLYRSLPGFLARTAEGIVLLSTAWSRDPKARSCRSGRRLASAHGGRARTARVGNGPRAQRKLWLRHTNNSAFAAESFAFFLNGACFNRRPETTRARCDERYGLEEYVAEQICTRRQRARHRVGGHRQKQHLREVCGNRAPPPRARRRTASSACPRSWIRDCCLRNVGIQRRAQSHDLRAEIARHGAFESGARIRTERRGHRPPGRVSRRESRAHWSHARGAGSTGTRRPTARPRRRR